MTECSASPARGRGGSDSLTVVAPGVWCGQVLNTNLRAAALYDDIDAKFGLHDYFLRCTIRSMKTVYYTGGFQKLHARSSSEYETDHTTEP